jgi:xanthine/CO dehydrogenase XdhC/CoxF family maturation factor
MLSSGDATEVGTISDGKMEARFTPTMLSMVKLKATLLPLDKDAIAAALAFSHAKTIGYDPDMYSFSYEAIKSDPCMTQHSGGGYGGVRGPNGGLERTQLRHLVFFQSEAVLLADHPTDTQASLHPSILRDRIKLYQQQSNDLIHYDKDITDQRHKLVVVYDNSKAVLMTHDYKHGLYIHLKTLDDIQSNAGRVFCCFDRQCCV